LGWFGSAFCVSAAVDSDAGGSPIEESGGNRLKGRTAGIPAVHFHYHRNWVSWNFPAKCVLLLGCAERQYERVIKIAKF
jgi:hypothetical protein